MSFLKKIFGRNKSKIEEENLDLENEQRIINDLEEQPTSLNNQSVEKMIDEVENDKEEAKELQVEETEEQISHELEENYEELIHEIKEAEEEVNDLLEEAAQSLAFEEKETSQDEALSSDKVEYADETTLLEENEDEEETPKKKGFIKRLFSGLTKTRDNILKGVDDVLKNFKQIDEELYEELEEALIMADFGVETTMLIMDRLKVLVKERKIVDPALLKDTLQEIIKEMLMGQPEEAFLNPDGPTVILVIGVNGVGKTTSIGKMAHSFKNEHKKVLIAAADTFRAAAIEQLSIWADRAGVDVIKHEEGTDAAAVVFDAIQAAKSRKTDVLICDTAGRLQNKTNLMKELEKISRIISREYPEAKREVLIALDATTGQNAIQQVKLFKEVADINGIILTKLDGTAKGGAIVGIYETQKVPVKYIGVGEKIDDLQRFDPGAFAKALFETE